MRKIALMAGATWLAASVIGSNAALAAMPEPSRYKADIHNRLAAEQAKAPRVSEDAARQIAWRAGVDHIEEIGLSGELWEVAGRDREGNEKALAIHAEDGRVLD